MAGCAGPWSGVGNAEAMTWGPWAVASRSLRGNSSSSAHAFNYRCTTAEPMGAPVPSKPARSPLCL